MSDNVMESTVEAAEAAAKTMGERVKAAGEQIRASGEHMAQTGSDFGLKLLDQAEANMREAFAALRATAQAKDAGEVMRIQSDFVREQGARAVSQAREIGELINNFGREAINRITGKN